MNNKKNYDMKINNIAEQTETLAMNFNLDNARVRQQRNTESDGTKQQYNTIKRFLYQSLKLMGQELIRFMLRA